MGGGANEGLPLLGSAGLYGGSCWACAEGKYPWCGDGELTGVCAGVRYGLCDSDGLGEWLNAWL